MRSRSHWRSLSLEENLNEWITPVVEKHVLGYKSHGEFLADSVRRRVENLVDSGIHPWSRYHTSKEKPHELAHHAIQAAVLLVAITAVAGMVHANAPAADLFSALEAMRPADFYARHASWIDFALMLALFTSVAQATIGRHFNHRGVAVTLGVALTVGFAASEAALGYNLRSFGPAAVTLLLGLLGVAAYRFAREVSLEREASGLLSLLLGIVGAGAFWPGIWLSPFGVVFAVGGIVLALLFARSLHHHFGGHASLEPVAGSALDMPLAGLVDEQKVLAAYLDGIARQSRKSAEQVLRELAYLLELAGRFDRPEQLTAIARKLDAVLPQSGRELARAREIRQALEQLRQFSERALGKLAAKHRALPQEQRKQLRAALDSELQEGRIVEKLEAVVEALKSSEEKLREALGRAAVALKAGAAVEARRELANALVVQRGVLDLTAKLQDLQRDLDVLAEFIRNQLSQAGQAVEAA